MNINILGIEYEIKLCDLNCEELPDNDGVCQTYRKKILVREPKYMFKSDDLEEEKKERFKEVLVHELVHAYCRESGVHYDDDENLVDWIAFMMPKVVDSYNEIIRKLSEAENG